MPDSPTTGYEDIIAVDPAREINPRSRRPTPEEQEMLRRAHLYAQTSSEGAYTYRLTHTVPNWYDEPQEKAKQSKPKMEKKSNNIVGIANLDPYIFCRSCRKRKHVSEMANIIDDPYVCMCKECATGNYKHCDECDTFFINSCACEKEVKHGDGRVEAYNWKKLPIKFRVNESDKLFMGLELEMEWSKGTPVLEEYLKRLHGLPWIYFKRDGSVPKGFEIVTEPLSWEWIKAHRDEIAKLEGLTRFDVKSRLTHTCGFHIHVSKDAFSTMHLYHILKFFRDNMPLVIRISGRTRDSLYKWANPSELFLGEHRIRGIAKTKRTEGRHSLINMLNYGTIEFRFFKGVLSTNLIYKNIEFIKSIYDITQNIKFNDSIDYRHYLEYVKNNYKMYPELAHFLDIHTPGLDIIFNNKAKEDIENEYKKQNRD